MSETQTYDVVVIGGGPAGATIASLLAKRGHGVLLIERESFPRYHVGESLITGMVPIMEELGVVEHLEEKFTNKYGITLVWGNDPQPWRTPFGQAGPYDHSWHVTRSEFDELLLVNARRLGVDVVEQARLGEVLKDETEDRVVGVTYQHEEHEYRVESRYVVDASGQNRTVVRHLTEVSWHDDLRNVATWGYFTSYKPLGEGAGGDILIEAVHGGGWLWGIPLSEKKISLGYVLPVELMKEKTAQGRSQEDLFTEAIASSQLAKNMLAGAERAEDLRTIRDWSHVCDRFHGPGWVAVGDAAAFVDPLFSSGVWLGTSGAWLAARAIDAALADPAQQEHALDRFEAVYRQLFVDILAYVRFFYDPSREREDYLQRAQEATKMFTSNSQVGFVSLISGITSLPDLVNFDPMGMEGLQDTVREQLSTAAPSQA